MCDIGPDISDLHDAEANSLPDDNVYFFLYTQLGGNNLF